MVRGRSGQDSPYILCAYLSELGKHQREVLCKNCLNSIICWIPFFICVILAQENREGAEAWVSRGGGADVKKNT